MIIHMISVYHMAEKNKEPTVYQREGNITTKKILFLNSLGNSPVLFFVVGTTLPSSLKVHMSSRLSVSAFEESQRPLLVFSRTSL